MVHSVLLVLTENFDDMMFLTSQVILEELGVDVLICSKENGTAKGQDSSVMTVALSEAINQQTDYAGIILIHGSNFSNWNQLSNILREYQDLGKIIGFTSSSLEILRPYGFEVSGLDQPFVVKENLVYLMNLESAEQFIQKFSELLSQ